MKRVRKVAIGVVFRKFPEGIKFILLRRRYGKNWWEFPKGGVELGETVKQAAIREVSEETGLKRLKVVKRINGAIIYNYPKEYARKHGYAGTEQKAFLIESLGGDVRLETHSFNKFAWLSGKDAIKRLKWDNQRNLLRRILKGRSAKK
ncbi:MAG: NUDIX domain-containing protein [Candidatus Aenigmarchaeota archaeon]|nr:NUDIX domain-containing protein [Candidatus Aenigmarchaeota archaeon]